MEDPASREYKWLPTTNQRLEYEEDDEVSFNSLNRLNLQFRAESERDMTLDDLQSRRAKSLSGASAALDLFEKGLDDKSRQSATEVPSYRTRSLRAAPRRWHLQAAALRQSAARQSAALLETADVSAQRRDVTMTAQPVVDGFTSSSAALPFTASVAHTSGLRTSAYGHSTEAMTSTRASPPARAGQGRQHTASRSHLEFEVGPSPELGGDGPGFSLGTSAALQKRPTIASSTPSHRLEVTIPSSGYIDHRRLLPRAAARVPAVLPSTMTVLTPVDDTGGIQHIRPPADKKRPLSKAETERLALRRLANEARERLEPFSQMADITDPSLEMTRVSRTHSIEAASCNGPKKRAKTGKEAAATKRVPTLQFAVSGENGRPELDRLALLRKRGQPSREARSVSESASCMPSVRAVASVRASSPESRHRSEGAEITPRRGADLLRLRSGQSNILAAPSIVPETVDERDRPAERSETETETQSQEENVLNRSETEESFGLEPLGASSKRVRDRRVGKASGKTDANSRKRQKLDVSVSGLASSSRSAAGGPQSMAAPVTKSRAKPKLKPKSKQPWKTLAENLHKKKANLKQCIEECASWAERNKDVSTLFAEFHFCLAKEHLDHHSRSWIVRIYRQGGTVSLGWAADSGCITHVVYIHPFAVPEQLGLSSMDAIPRHIWIVKDEWLGSMIEKGALEFEPDSRAPPARFLVRR